MTDFRDEIEAMDRDQLRALAGLLGLARPSPEGRKALHAYVVPQRDGIDIEALRTEAASRLPAHMAPDTITILDDIPRRPNGKIDRRALPEPIRATPRPETRGAQEAAPGGIEATLLGIWCDLLGADYLEPDDDFFEFGGDSILAIHAIARARDAGIEIDPGQLFKNPTVAALGQMVSWRGGEASGAERAAQTEARALPIQRWFLDRTLAEPGHWNLARLLDLNGSWSDATLEAAIDAILDRHAGLRTHFRRGDDGWVQDVAPVCAADVFEIEDSTALPPDEMAYAHAKRAFDVEAGPLVRFVKYETGPARPDQLLIVAHHLAMDAISWSFLIADLSRAAIEIARGAAPRWDKPAASPLTHAQKLEAYVKSPAFERNLAYWRGFRDESGALPPELSELVFEHTEADVAYTARTLTGPAFDALRQTVHGSFNTRNEDFVAAAVVLALQSLSGRRAFMIETESHGRDHRLDSPDLAPPVGWLTSHFPVWLVADPEGDPVASLKSVKEGLRAVPASGIAYGAARYWEGLADTLPGLEGGLLLNYLGTAIQGAGSLGAFASADLPQDGLRAPANARGHALELNVWLHQGGLTIAAVHASSSAADVLAGRLMDAILEKLHLLIDAVQQNHEIGFTPSDFPEAGLSQDELDAFLDGL